MVKHTFKSSLKLSLIALSLAAFISACSDKSSLSEDGNEQEAAPMAVQTQTKNALGHHTLGQGKPVIYQVFTRLFGNTNTTNKPWGTIEENGVGKFDDFTDEALQGIRELGTSYIWYTGVPHHAVINDYTDYGISLDDPDVVKGRAGSPYAVKDYYNVNPDLANDVEQRLQEFEGLIARTHENGMKVIIDIVPNHVARDYDSLSKPSGEDNFGANDDSSVEYARDNNFYYIPNQSFAVPQSDSYQVLGGDSHPLADGKFEEVPAKWTGNGSREPQPDINDWYETVKVNYGVKPDGTYDFERLPDEFRVLDYQAHHAFWADKSLPDSWYKFESIVHYWLDKGVDGFRFDMAEMVPVEFWSFLNSSIKTKRPDALLLAEVYQPHLYRDYIELGKMDYLYDKVEFYDALKPVMQGSAGMSAIADIQASMSDIEAHMLHFLENHDEQRIASPEFAGSAEKGKPALVVSALISRSPTMIYFGQEVGEDGSEETGFGDPSRTTIFDYAGVPAHQRWMNEGKFDGALLSDKEKELRQYYIDVLNISAYHRLMRGAYDNIHALNINAQTSYSQQQFAFVRHDNTGALLIVSNFSKQSVSTPVQLPIDLIVQWGLDEGQYVVNDLISDEENYLQVDRKRSAAAIDVNLAPLESKVYELSFEATR
ncbi:alpha-amylase family glycosyl hydrolase [Glaciecola siphonariae]|uniref:Alpha-amylase family glycosyl hydrolase n=1 Tax=Glaciecola siphonariae TaxID=521012 RepID=A0ABV9LTG6_9ALTE